MAFNANDYYTVTNGVKLYGYWNPFVTKFNSTSFYNWEQDNLPMYDLEERTAFLWERGGWATSSVPGLALVVENTKQPDNNNSFDNLQDAVDALPDVLRQPVMIEVLKTGDLGKLELNNIKFGEGGSLEILNAAKIDIKSTEYKSAGVNEDDANYYHIESLVTSVTGQTPVSDWLTAAKSLVRSDEEGSDYKLLANGILPQLGQNPSTANLKGGYFVAPYGATTAGHRPDRPSIYHYQGKNFASDSTVWATQAGNNIVSYDITNVGSTVVDPERSYDLTSVSKRSSVDSGVAFAGGQGVNGLWTNNTLRAVNIKNCDGPIYVRGFFVDGTDNTDAGSPVAFNKYGISIYNSQQIFIENCVSVRNTEGGLLINNSEVVLNRKFLTGRNYNPIENTRELVDHYGVKVVNSSLTLSSDSECYGKDAVLLSYENDYGIFLENSKLKGFVTSYSDVTTEPTIRVCYNAKAGIYAVNSKIETDSILDVHSNTKGVWLRDSELDAFRMFYQYNSEIGLLSEGSKVVHGKIYDTAPATSRVATNSTQTFAVDGVAYDYDILFFGNRTNIELKNSEYLPLYRDDMPAQLGAQLISSHTGVESGHFIPSIRTYNSTAEFIHCRLSTTRSAGSVFATEIVAPVGTSLGTAIDMYNSKIAFLGTSKMATIITGPSTNVDHNGVYISNNSTCRFSGPTFMSGFRRPLIVDKSSVLDVCPHKYEAAYGYPDDKFKLEEDSLNHTTLEVLSRGECIIVDNNSTLNMRDLGSSLIKYPTNLRETDYLWSDISGYHHAGGVILAPNDPDTAITAGPGSLARYYNAPNTFVFTGAAFNNRPYNYYFLGGTRLDNENWQDTSKGGVCVAATNNSNVNLFNVSFHTGDVNADDVFYQTNSGLAGCSQLRIWSFGSGSTLNASLLACSGTYPSLAGYHGPRSVYFSANGAGNERPDDVAYTAFRAYPYGYTGDTSTMNLINYPGGKANLNRRVNTNEYVGSSVGFGTSPYVSGLAVLDYFGSGTIINGHESFAGGDYTDYIRNIAEGRYDLTKLATILNLGSGVVSKFWGASGYANQGPFRLYLEPDPICQYMTYLSGFGGEVNNKWGLPSALDYYALSSDNRPYQTISQGYHLSGPVHIDPYYAQEWRPDLRYELSGLFGTGVTLQTSGYPDIADLVRPENYNIRLDESAAHMFANAKHCSIPFLGRPPLVEIYRNSNTRWGARIPTSTQVAGYGAGFKSPHTFNTGRR